MTLKIEPLAIYYERITSQYYLEYIEFKDFMFLTEVNKDDFVYFNKASQPPAKEIHQNFTSDVCRQLFGEISMKGRKVLLETLRDEVFKQVGENIFLIDDYE